MHLSNCSASNVSMHAPKLYYIWCLFGGIKWIYSVHNGFVEELWCIIRVRRHFCSFRSRPSWFLPISKDLVLYQAYDDILWSFSRFPICSSTFLEFWRFPSHTMTICGVLAVFQTSSSAFLEFYPCCTMGFVEELWNIVCVLGVFPTCSSAFSDFGDFLVVRWHVSDC